LIFGALALSSPGAPASARTEHPPCPDCPAPDVQLRGPTPQDEAEITGFFGAAIGPKFRLADYSLVGGPSLDEPLTRRFERDVRRGNVTLPWGVLPNITVENGQAPTAFVFMLERKDEPLEGYVVLVVKSPSLGWKITGIGDYIH
jgi:hypothetical protein